MPTFARSLAVVVLALLAPGAVRAAGPDAATSAKHLTASQSYLATIRAPQAWSRTSDCSGAVVAVVDSGVDAANPALAGALLPGWNVLTGTSDTADTEGHGTMVAGLVAARPARGLAASGVCRRARIMPVVVWSSKQKPTDTTIAAGITWAADHGASVINVSLGGSSPSAAIARAVRGALARDIVVVAAAGNDFDSSPQYPAAYRGVLAVSASDAQGHRPSFSSFGSWVGVAAPGTTMLSTRGTTVAVSDGTSFAAPLVSGAAALLRTEHPNWSEQQIVRRIEQTADDAGPFGPDPSFGDGVLDLAAAVGATSPTRKSIGRPDAGEPNDLPDEAQPLAVGRTLTADFAPENDVDWYAVTVKKPTELVVSAAPTTGEVTDLVRRTSMVVSAYGPSLGLLASRDARYDGQAGGLMLSFPAARPGRYYLRVTNAFGSRGGYTIGVGRSQLSPWAAWTDFANGSEANAVATGDLNGDGRTDVLLASTQYFSPVYANQLLLYAQRRDGTLAPPRILRRASRLCCGDVAVGDLNGDRRADLVGTIGVDGLELFTQHRGALGRPRVVHTKSAAESVAFLGRDLVVGEANGLHLLVPHGTLYRDTLLDSASPLAVRVADLNRDGRLDVVATERNGLSVFLRGATGGFMRKRVSLAERPTGPLAVGDLNGDGRADVAVATAHGAELELGSATGLRAGVSVTAPSAPLAIADLNGDGRADLAVGNTIFLQSRGGSLGRGEPDGSTEHGFGADTLAAADVNGDGRPDLVWAGGYGLVVVPRRSAYVAPPVWVTGATPAPQTERVATTATPSVRFARALVPASVSARTVHLVDEHGNPLAAAVRYDGKTRTVTLKPRTALAGGQTYEVEIAGVRDTSGDVLRTPFTAGFLTAASPAP